MLHEFAVEPEVLSSWHQFRYITEKFGIEHGRLISKFPKNWKRRVYDACARCGDVEKKRIEESLKSIDARLIATCRPYGSDPAWLVNAEAEHGRRPFRAIVGKTNPRSQNYVLVADELDETADLWIVRRELKVRRGAREMAACVGTLFQVSRTILFVDPHFKPEMERYRSTLCEFLRVAYQSRTGYDRIEYHLKAACTPEFFVDACDRFLLRRVPRDCEVTFYRWAQRTPGEALHARYILTDVGGLRFEHGLDAGEPDETTDVGILDRLMHSERLRDYQRSSVAKFDDTYELIDKVRLVGGRDVVQLGISE